MAKTSRTTVYVVQPYQTRGRVWEAGNPVRLSSLPQAERLAAAALANCCGATVLSLEVAEDVDFCGEPVVIASYGQVPELAG